MLFCPFVGRLSLFMVLFPNHHSKEYATKKQFTRNTSVTNKCRASSHHNVCRPLHLHCDQSRCFSSSIRPCFLLLHRHLLQNTNSLCIISPTPSFLLLNHPRHLFTLIFSFFHLHNFTSSYPHLHFYINNV